jgi:hypothetical protein
VLLLLLPKPKPPLVGGALVVLLPKPKPPRPEGGAVLLLPKPEPPPPNDGEGDDVAADGDDGAADDAPKVPRPWPNIEELLGGCCGCCGGPPNAPPPRPPFPKPDPNISVSSCLLPMYSAPNVSQFELERTAAHVGQNRSSSASEE